MPLLEPDETDPMLLEGIGMDGGPGALERMAEDLVDEFVRVGTDEAHLLELFRNPFYALPHGIYQQRGEAWVRELIARVAVRWRRR